MYYRCYFRWLWIASEVTSGECVFPNCKSACQKASGCKELAYSPCSDDSECENGLCQTIYGQLIQSCAYDGTPCSIDQNGNHNCKTYILHSNGCGMHNPKQCTGKQDISGSCSQDSDCESNNCIDADSNAPGKMGYCGCNTDGDWPDSFVTIWCCFIRVS